MRNPEKKRETHQNGSSKLKPMASKIENRFGWSFVSLCQAPIYRLAVTHFAFPSATVRHRFGTDTIPLKVLKLWAINTHVRVPALLQHRELTDGFQHGVLYMTLKSDYFS